MTSFSVERASYYRRCPKLSEVRRFPFGDSLTQLSSLITRERLDQFKRYTCRSPAFWTLFHMKSTCFRVAVLLKYILVKQCSFQRLAKAWWPGKNESLGMPNAQVLTSISMFYWEVTPSEKSVLSLYSVSSIKYHQNMKKFCLMNIMFLKDKHGDG